MNFKTKLSERIGMTDIHEITLVTQYNNKRKQELYNLLFDTDDFIAFQAAWALMHFSRNENEWLYDKQNELIEEVLICKHPGKRRLLLTLIFRQPLTNPSRTDFLDFCHNRMVSKQELPGVRTLRMKLAYEMCRCIPELTRELRMMLDMMETEMLEKSMRSARKNVLDAMKSGKTVRMNTHSALICKTGVNGVKY